MADEIISLRIGKELKSKMRMHSHINWSAIIRRALAEEVLKLHKIDRAKALRAFESAKKTRESGVFSGGKTGAEIIREWRDKRR